MGRILVVEVAGEGVFVAELIKNRTGLRGDLDIFVTYNYNF